MTKQRERPVHLRDWEVRAVLEGRKTLLLVPVNPQPVGTPPWHKGDRLWVREAWCEDEDEQLVVFYRATDHPTCGQPWRSPMHMPRRYSRITLEVEDVRVGKILSLTETDAINHGATYHDGLGIGNSGWRCDKESDVCGNACAAVWDDWDSRYSKRGYSTCCSNPWVWAAKVRRVE
jgi:hypothetical protein